MFSRLQNKQKQKHGEDVISWHDFYSYLSFAQYFLSVRNENKISDA